MKKSLAIDIGGTKTSYCVINELGEILSPINKIKTEKTVEDIVSNLKRIINENENEVDCISIATAGAVLSRDAKISVIAALSRKPNRPSGFRLPLKLNSCNRR